MLVDLVGVVTAVAPVGSVKRKADNSELSRRDVTLVDQSAKSVALTLWGALAEGVGAELEALSAAGGEAPILAVSACRVSSYNGEPQPRLGGSGAALLGGEGGAALEMAQSVGAKRGI